MTGPPGSIIQESTVFTLQTVEKMTGASDELTNFFLCMSSTLEKPVCQPDTYSPLFNVNNRSPPKERGPTNMFPETPLSVTSQMTDFLSLLGNPTAVPVSAQETFVPQITIGPDGTSTIMVPSSLATQATITSIVNNTGTAAHTNAASMSETSASLAADHDGNKSSEGIATGTKVGIAAGAIGAVIAAILLGLFCYRRRNSASSRRESVASRNHMPMLSRPRMPRIPISIHVRRRNDSPIENLMASTLHTRDLSSEKHDMMTAPSLYSDDDESLYSDYHTPPPVPGKQVSSASASPALIGFTPTKNLSPRVVAMASPHASPEPRHSRHKRNMSSLSLSKSPRPSMRARSATGDLLVGAGLILEQQTVHSREHSTHRHTRQSSATLAQLSPLAPPPPLHFAGDTPRDSTMSNKTFSSVRSKWSRFGGSGNNKHSIGGLAVPMGRDGGRGMSALSGNSSFLNVPFLGFNDPNMSAEEIERLEEEERRIDEAIAAAERVATPRIRSLR